MKASASDPIARYCKVFLDGVDVTQDCTFADEGAGLVHVYARDARGHRFVDEKAYGGPCVAQMEKLGCVRIKVIKVGLWLRIQHQMGAFADWLFVRRLKGAKG